MSDIINFRNISETFFTEADILTLLQRCRDVSEILCNIIVTVSIVSMLLFCNIAKTFLLGKSLII